MQTAPNTQVIVENQEELVFRKPVQDFYQRITALPPIASPLYSIAPHFLSFAAEDDLQRINAARQKVAYMKASLQKQLEQA